MEEADTYPFKVVMISDNDLEAVGTLLALHKSYMFFILTYTKMFGGMEKEMDQTWFQMSVTRAYLFAEEG